VEGRVRYADGLAWQRELARARIEGELDRDVVLLLEHEPVVTLGRGARDGGHVLAAPDVLARLGVDVVEVERGGDVTYHGPGQLVGYPILDLGARRRDLHWYLRTLEQGLILALRELELEGFRAPAYTGVWVGDPESVSSAAGRAAGEARKIASIGVHVSRWVTWHGFALNVTREPLEKFGLIVPCGIDEVRMTSLAAEGIDVDMNRTRELVGRGLGAAFGSVVYPGDPVPVGAGVEEIVGDGAEVEL
jgi:lipoyl(octanoyl) transferase